MRKSTIPGQLEIDHDRGVVYFHTTDVEWVEAHGMVTILRICQLPTPIPNDKSIDITHMHGVNYSTN